MKFTNVNNTIIPRAAKMVMKYDLTCVLSVIRIPLKDVGAGLFNFINKY